MWESSADDYDMPKSRKSAIIIIIIIIIIT